MKEKRMTALWRAHVFGGPPWKGKKIRYQGQAYTVTRGWSQTRHGVTTYRLSVTQDRLEEAYAAVGGI